MHDISRISDSTISTSHSIRYEINYLLVSASSAGWTVSRGSVWYMSTFVIFLWTLDASLVFDAVLEVCELEVEHVKSSVSVMICPFLMCTSSERFLIWLFSADFWDSLIVSSLLFDFFLNGNWKGNCEKAIFGALYGNAAVKWHRLHVFHLVPAGLAWKWSDASDGEVSHSAVTVSWQNYINVQ